MKSNEIKLCRYSRPCHKPFDCPLAAVHNVRSMELCSGVSFRGAFIDPAIHHLSREEYVRRERERGQVYVQINPEDMPCPHRGKQLPDGSCNTCGGDRGRAFDKFVCSIHGSCSIHKKHSRTKCCLTCPDNPMNIDPTAKAGWVVGVTTAPRNDPTLDKCLDSLHAAEFTSITLFSEPNVDYSKCVDKVTSVVQRKERFGAWRNWLAMVNQLLETDAERFLLMQDDTVIATTAMEKLNTMWPRSDSVGLVSLYTPSHYQRKFEVVKTSNDRVYRSFDNERDAQRFIDRKSSGFIMVRKDWPNGLNRIHTKALWGACALAFNRKSLEALAEHKIAKTWRGAGSRLEQEARAKRPWTIVNIDTAIGHVMNALNLSMHFYNPSLAQHIARHSSLPGHGGLGNPKRSAAVVDPSVPIDVPQSPSSTVGMVQQVFILTRSCYGDANLKAEGLRPRDYAGYRERRMQLFEALSARSICAQSDQEFTWVLRVDANESPELRARREKALEGFMGRVVYSATGGRWTGVVDENTDEDATHVVQIRLDDDDALHNGFVERLKGGRKKSSEPVWYTFPNGCRVNNGMWWRHNHVGNQFTALQIPVGYDHSKCDIVKQGKGTTLDIFSVVHGRIGHKDWKNKLPATVIDNEIAWLWYRHDDSKSGGGKTNCKLDCGILQKMFTIHWPSLGVTWKIPRLPAGARTKTAVVIISHNYGRFVGDAIESVLRQSVRPDEVLVVNDSSTDNTADVVKEYASKGVRYAVTDYKSVFRNRALGCQHTSSDYLVFLDADDKLPPDYLERGIEVFESDHRIGVVYSDMKRFGERETYHKYGEFDRDRLQRRNFMHAGSMVRRDALRQSGVFELELRRHPNRKYGHEDWFIWRTALGQNWTALKSKAVYQYRAHGSNFCATKRITDKRDYFEYGELMNETITIFIPLSGRDKLWWQLANWLNNQTWPHDQIRIQLIDTSQNADFATNVRAWLAGCDYYDFSYRAMTVGAAGLADKERREDAYMQQCVRDATAQVLNTLPPSLTTPYVLILEDDILPPLDAIKSLMREMDPETVSVSGAYLSRYQENTYVARRDGEQVEPEDGVTVEEVDTTGFGCVLMRSEIVTGNVFTAVGMIADVDTAFFSRIESGKKLHWGVRCNHFSADGQAVELVSDGDTAAENPDLARA